MKKILLGFVALIVLIIAALGIAIATFDINKHRDQIEAALSKETGRTVKFSGDIHVGVSMKGITLALHDVSFGNPAWASRPNLASIKLFDLKVGLMPLLEHRVDITGLAIENADIQLETASENRHNWDMQIGGDKSPEEKTAEKKAEAGQPVAINLGSLSIKDSRIAMRGEDGKTTVFKADSLTLGREGAGTGLHFGGSFNDMPIAFAALTNADALTSKAVRPLDIDLTFANYHLTANGKIDVAGKKANFEKYELASGNTKISGHLAAGWGGARPALQGTIASENLVPADLKMANAKADAVDNAAPTDAASPRVFSDAPLALSGLKSVDVNLDVAITALLAGTVEIQNLKGKLVINNGHLFLSPFSMAMGEGQIKGELNLDASETPARLSTKWAVADVDLKDLIKAGGAEAFLSGRVKADVNLSSSGNSMHDLASNLSGPISMISAGGDVISSASGKLSAGLAEILSPGSGNKNEGMNCLVARFNALNGVVKGNGILIDTGAATVAGYGDIDLRSESLNLDFHAKPKLINAGGLLPPLHVGGTMKNPAVGANAQALIQNVSAMLLNGGVAPSDSVPDLQTQQGQNACAYTLDHPTAPKAAAPSQGGVVQDVAGKAQNLIKGLFGN